MSSTDTFSQGYSHTAHHLQGLELFNNKGEKQHSEDKASVFRMVGGGHMGGGCSRGWKGLAGAA